MKWKSKEKTQPQLNDIRTVRKFAWLPTETVDGCTVWLETYQETQIYRKSHIINKFSIPLEVERWELVHRSALYVQY